MTIFYDPRCLDYSASSHPERPDRIARTAPLLKDRHPEWDWREPIAATDDELLRAHSRQHLERVATPNQDFDADTPWYLNVEAHAQRSAGAAIETAHTALRGEPAFSLMRPPGHHATQDRAMGFCYLSNIAIAVLDALATGAKRVAVYDFDVHHGNGTEAVLLNKPNSALFSIHQFPCYPGTGGRNVGNNCFNYPVPPQTPRVDYRHVLESALEHLKDFNPDLVGVSAGFDAYARDPLAEETLEPEDYHWLGQSLRKLGVPVFSLLEGGYSD